MSDDGMSDAKPDYEALYKVCLRKLERERRVRREAEAIAEKGLRTLYLRERQQALLESVAAHANGASSKLDTLNHAMEEVCRHFGWACGMTYTVEPLGLTRTTHVYVETPDLEIFIAARGPDWRAGPATLPGQAADAASPVWVERLQDDASFLRRDMAHAAGLSSGAAFPISVGRSVVAVIEVFSIHKRQPDPALMAVMLQVGMQVGRAFEREAASARLAYDARHDALTGLPNRFALVAELDAAIRRTLRGESDGFLVAFIDLDRFKVINDSLGHEVGDDYLRCIARRFAEAARKWPGAMLARIGGDEFVLIVDQPNVCSGTASNLGETLLKSLTQPIGVGLHNLCASASIGVARSSAGYASGAEIMRDADSAMYRAKAKGRGRVVVFNETLLPETKMRHHQ